MDGIVSCQHSESQAGLKLEFESDDVYFIVQFSSIFVNEETLS